MSDKTPIATLIQAYLQTPEGEICGQIVAITRIQNRNILSVMIPDGNDPRGYIERDWLESRCRVVCAVIK